MPKISFHPYNYAVSSDVSLYILLLCLLEVPIFNKTRMECKKFLPFFYFFLFFSQLPQGSTTILGISVTIINIHPYTNSKWDNQLCVNDIHLKDPHWTIILVRVFINEFIKDLTLSGLCTTLPHVFYNSHCKLGCWQCLPLSIIKAKR